MKKLLLCFLTVLFMGGCAATAAPPMSAPQPSAHETYAAAMIGCAGAIEKISAGTGDATAKVVAVGAIERLCGQGANQLQVAMQPQRVEAPVSLFQAVWQGALQVGDIALRGYGIKTQRDIAINQSNSAAATTQASYLAFTGLGNAIGNTSAAISTAGFSALQASSARPTTATTINVSGSGPSNIGSGTLNIASGNSTPTTNSNNTTPTTTSNSNNTVVTRTCNGGQAGNGAPGGSTSSGTTGSTGGGAGAPGGGAQGGNC